MLSPSGHPDVIPRARSHPDYCSCWEKKNLGSCSQFVLAVLRQHVGNSLGSEERWSGWVPLKFPCWVPLKFHPPRTFPGSCQNLKAAAKHFSWDKQAFFFPLLLSIFPSSCASDCIPECQELRLWVCSSAPAWWALKYEGSAAAPANCLAMAHQRLRLHPKPHSSLTPQWVYYSNHWLWCKGWGSKCFVFFFSI